MYFTITEEGKSHSLPSNILKLILANYYNCPDWIYMHSTLCRLNDKSES